MTLGHRWTRTTLSLACLVSLLGPRLGLLSPSPAQAVEGIGFTWNKCFGEAGSAQNAAFACNTNAGSHLIYGAFVLNTPMPIVIGVEIRMNLVSDGDALPSWWQFKNPGTCRQNSLTATFTADPGDAFCVDWSNGLSVGGLAGYCTSTASCGAGQPANTARIPMVAAVATANALDLLANQQYFAFAMQLDHDKTVGAGACDGCERHVCIVLNSINVVARDNVEQRLITTPLAPGANTITWQGGVPGGGGLPGCVAATPVQRSTWGAVKSLYR